MAYELNITPAIGKVFHDTDRVLRFTVYAGDPTAAQIAAGTAVPQDVAGWAMSWTLRLNVNATTPLISKTTGAGIAIVGVFNVLPAVNTQRVEVTLEDTDTYNATAIPPVDIRPSTTYVHALKRTDDGSEGVLTWGTFTLLKSAARD